MAEPGDEKAAGASGHGDLRASHADREQVIETLKAAFVQGRLDRDEFDLRVDQTFVSRTYAELGTVTADIPAGLTPPEPPVPARAQDGRVLRPGPVAAAATLLYAGVWVYAILFPGGPDSDANGERIMLGGLFYLIILAICVGQAAAWGEKRSGGQSAQRPAAGAGGQAPQRLPQPTRGRSIRGLCRGQGREVIGAGSCPRANCRQARISVSANSVFSTKLARLPGVWHSA